MDEDVLRYVKELLNNDADDIIELKKIARLMEEGSRKVGKRLSKEEFKAGLDALWGDAGVEGALAAIERCFKGGFQYINDPLDNMKASRDIVRNPVSELDSVDLVNQIIFEDKHAKKYI